MRRAHERADPGETRDHLGVERTVVRLRHAGEPTAPAPLTPPTHAFGSLDRVVGVTIAARRRRLRLLAAAAALAVSLVLPAGAGAATAQAKGIDVSHWNGVIDWIRVAGGGYQFVFGKATEGFTLVDPTYSINRAGTEGFGLSFGAYHFARPSGTSDAAATVSAIAQADHFVDVAQPQPGELPPVLDLEKTGNLKPARLQTWTRAWLNEVTARTGVAPFIYASPNFWKNVARRTPPTSPPPGTASGSRTGRRRRHRSSRPPTGAGSAGRSGSGPTARWYPASRTARTATG